MTWRTLHCLTARLKIKHLLFFVCNAFFFSLQTVPDRPAGLHRSLPIVAWIEWKLVQILSGEWSFRSCDSKTKSYVDQLAATKKHSIKGGKYLRYNTGTKTMVVSLPDQADEQEPDWGTQPATGGAQAGGA